MAIIRDQRVSQRAETVRGWTFMENYWNSFQTKYMCNYSDVENVLYEKYAERARLFLLEIPYEFRGLYRTSRS